jgi:hypothetical protein
MQILNDLVVTIVWVPIALVALNALASLLLPRRQRQRVS